MKKNLLTPIKKIKKQYWLYQCQCGNAKIISLYDIKYGKTRSCGCLRKIITSNTGKNNKTHGMKNNIFYRKYQSIISRCKYVSSSNYKNYGGRNIKCLWKSFLDFKKDMYKSYLEHCKKFGEKNTTIDRINNDGNYCKENCRWATWSEQYENKSNLRFITYKNKKQTLTKWSKELELNATTISDRLKAGWSIEDALFQRVSPLKLKLRIKN